MDLNSPLFDRIRTARAQKSAEETVLRARCNHPGCAAPGEFRAPMGRLREGQYFSFCLEHVREYNATYNYFHGMSDEAVSRYQKDAITGHRPTWTMGANRATFGDPGPRARDPFNMFGSGRDGPQPKPTPRVGVAARKALTALGLDEDSISSVIKARYKELVKRLHPDANGGDRSSEDRLREIINAYNILRDAKLV